MSECPPEIRTILSKTINALVTAGEDTLNPGRLKQLKSYCRDSPVCIDTVYHLVFSKLQKPHAQVRYAAAQIIIELFNRSHQFRQLLVKEFPRFLSLTLGIYQEALPPPEAYAKKLKKLVIQTVKVWRSKYGTFYKPLQLGYEYIRQKLNVNFDSVSDDVLSHVESRRRREALERKKVAHQQRFLRIRDALQDYATEVLSNNQEMEAALGILVPDIAGLFHEDGSSHPTTSTSNATTYTETMASLGMAAAQYQVNINFDTDNLYGVRETPENQVIFDQLREDLKVLVRKHWPQVQHWLTEISQLMIDDTKEVEHSTKQLIDLKYQMSVLKRKCTDLRIDVPEVSDDEFEDVPIPQDSTSPPVTTTPSPRKSNPEDPVPSMLDIDRSAYLAMANRRLHNAQQAEEKNVAQEDPQAHLTEVEKELIAQAPVLDYGPELHYWDKDTMPLNQSGIEVKHRFYGEGRGDEDVPQVVMDQLRKRVIYLKPTRPTDIKACRAPMKNGQLCPRRDLVSCPYHGKKVPRNESGGVVADSFEALQKGKAPETVSSEPSLGEDDQLDVFEEITTTEWNPAGTSSTSTSHNSTSQIRGADMRAIYPEENLSHRYGTTLQQDIEQDVLLALGKPAGQIMSPHTRGQRSSRKRKSNLIDLESLQNHTMHRLKRKLGGR
ncbi:hypothetical protein IWQ62_001229 [Dispira parvispora]|uniref:UV-stimulated scaffold protein A C-terminal domain-containing protein n=1 Tax=Dispira parvispora TaxID=1520584 RepID=A0A9W8E8E6_9FUNG|nr:hypothetical protein IWQ62_001229 [Dispira parvispora]